MDTTEYREPLTIRLDSEIHEANAVGVASMMSAIVALVSEAHRSMEDNQELLVKARPFAKGSLDIPLDLIVMTAGTLLTTSPLIESILDVLKKYIEVKNLLKGEPFKRKDDKTIVFNDYEFNIGSISLNLLGPISHANQKMAKALKHLEKDKTIRGIEILHGPDSKLLAKVARREFQYYSLALPESTKRQQEVRSREMLRIASPVFEGKAKWKRWGFIRKGSSIRAQITDKNFVKSVQSCQEAFAVGDTLDVDLVVHQEFDFGVSAFRNSSYTIAHVWNHERKKEKRQQQMFPDGGT